MSNNTEEVRKSPYAVHGIYRHYRNQKLYRIIGKAINHSHDDVSVIVYEPVEDTSAMYTRDYDEFFAIVTNDDGVKVPRFTHIHTETVDGLK